MNYTTCGWVSVEGREKTNTFHGVGAAAAEEEAEEYPSSSVYVLSYWDQLKLSRFTWLCS